jgi:hypothetical protein
VEWLAELAELAGLGFSLASVKGDLTAAILDFGFQTWAQTSLATSAAVV